MPQNDGSLLVNIEIGARRRAGQDDQRQVGPGFVHFFEEGIARDVRQVEIDQHRRPLIRTLIEGEQSRKTIRGMSDFIAVIFQ